MEKFVIIKNTMKDINSKDPYADIIGLLPQSSPHECTEKPYESLEAAIKDNPGFEVMTVEHFKSQQIKLMAENKPVFEAIKLRSKEIKLEAALKKVEP